MVVSHHVGCWKSNPDPLQDQQDLLSHLTGLKTDFFFPPGKSTSFLKLLIKEINSCNAQEDSHSHGHGPSFRTWEECSKGVTDGHRGTVGGF